ncbi:hypothetical protein Tco_0180416 [Tanacetum coccineum]
MDDSGNGLNSMQEELISSDRLDVWELSEFKIHNPLGGYLYKQAIVCSRDTLKGMVWPLVIELGTYNGYKTSELDLSGTTDCTSNVFSRSRRIGDSTGSHLASSDNPVQHSRTSSIDVRYHFIKEQILRFELEESPVQRMITFESTWITDDRSCRCHDDCKSTSRGIQFLGDKLVSWSSKKQDCTAMSTAEADCATLKLPVETPAHPFIGQLLCSSSSHFSTLLGIIGATLSLIPAVVTASPVFLLHLALLCTTLFGIKYNRSNDMKLVGYSDNSHNVDIDDGRSTTGHVFYLGTSPITWCSQNQTTIALSSCEAEFMAATAAACQAIWLRELLAEVIVEHVSGENQREDPLTKALAQIRFKEMRSLLGVQELPSST